MYLYGPEILYHILTDIYPLLNYILNVCPDHVVLESTWHVHTKHVTFLDYQFSSMISSFLLDQLYQSTLSCNLWKLYFRVTRRIPPVEQELLTLPEQLHSPSVISGVRVARSLVLCVIFCRSLFVLFHWPIALYVLLPFTASNFPFGILHILFYKLSTIVVMWHIRMTFTKEKPQGIKRKTKNTTMEEPFQNRRKRQNS